MMQRPHKLMWLVMLLVAGSVATAQETKIGKLDGERVFKEYKLYQQLNEELQAMGRQLINQYDVRRRRYPLLLDEEYNQLAALQQKRQQNAISPAEKTTLDKLEKLSDERDRELAELEGKGQLSTQENDRWRELLGIRNQANQMLRDQWERIQKSGEERARDIEQKLTAEIRTAVEEVAKQQGLSVVLQSEVVVFGGIDITDATLEILNNRPAPAGVSVSPAPQAGPVAPAPAADGGDGN